MPFFWPKRFCWGSTPPPQKKKKMGFVYPNFQVFFCGQNFRFFCKGNPLIGWKGTMLFLCDLNIFSREFPPKKPGFLYPKQVFFKENFQIFGMNFFWQVWICWVQVQGGGGIFCSKELLLFFDKIQENFSKRISFGFGKFWWWGTNPGEGRCLGHKKNVVRSVVGGDFPPKESINWLVGYITRWFFFRRKSFDWLEEYIPWETLKGIL